MTDQQCQTWNTGTSCCPDSRYCSYSCSYLGPCYSCYSCIIFSRCCDVLTESPPEPEQPLYDYSYEEEEEEEEEVDGQDLQDEQELLEKEESEPQEPAIPPPSSLPSLPQVLHLAASSSACCPLSLAITLLCMSIVLSARLGEP